MKYFLLLIFFDQYSLFTCEGTSLNGSVYSRDNKETWSLLNANLVLIMKRDVNHTDVQHFKLNVNQSTFPFHFQLNNLHRIKSGNNYLLSLLIFAYPHRLLWESSLTRQRITRNRINSFRFIVDDLSNLESCLLEGYPCIQSQTEPEDSISTCCNGKLCQHVSNHSQDLFTCQGDTPVEIDVNITYVVPQSVLPKLGRVSQEIVNQIRKRFQSDSSPGDLVIINNAYFVSVHNQLNDQNVRLGENQYQLVINAVIRSPANCRGNKSICRRKTINNIKSSKLTLMVDDENGFSTVALFLNPSINTTNIISTTTSTSEFTTTSTTELAAAQPVKINRVQPSNPRTFPSLVVIPELVTISASLSSTPQLTTMSTLLSATPEPTTIFTSSPTTASEVTTNSILTTHPEAATTSVNIITLRWNTTGTIVAEKELSYPLGIAIGPSNTLFVADSNYNRVQNYRIGNLSGTTVAGSPDLHHGTAATELYQPNDVAVDPYGNVYVADTQNHRIMLWSVNATSGIQVAGTGDLGSTNNTLSSPRGVAFDSNTNTLYISDTANDRVMKYEKNASSGVVVAGGNGRGTKTNQLYYPIGLHFEVTTNSLLIVNSMANNVVRWKLGESQWTLISGRLDGSSGGKANELKAPMDVISDRMGNIYVADALNSRVLLYLANQTNATLNTSSTNLPFLIISLPIKPYSIALDDQMNLYASNGLVRRVEQFKHY